MASLEIRFGLNLRPLALTALSMLSLWIAGCKGGPDTGTTFDLVIAHAKEASQKIAAGSTPIDGADLVPESASLEELRSLARQLKLHDATLDVYGDRGIALITQAFWRSLYRLAELENGATHLVMLLEDEALSWDAGHSLVLSDALVRCGKAALPKLRTVTRRKHLADRCIELINRGAKTAI